MKIKFQVNQIKSFEKICFGRTVYLSLYTNYAKDLTSLCFLSIVKRRHLLLHIFYPIFKKRIAKKKQQIE